MTDMTNKDLIERAKEALKGATRGPWLRTGGTVYTLREVFTRRGADVENAWEAHFMQDGQHKTTASEVEANAELSRMSPDLARLVVAADDALRLIGWDCDDHLSPEARVAIAHFRAIAEGKE